MGGRARRHLVMRVGAALLAEASSTQAPRDILYAACGPRSVQEFCGARTYIPYRKAYLSGMNPLSLVFFTFGELGTDDHAGSQLPGSWSTVGRSFRMCAARFSG